MKLKDFLVVFNVHAPFYLRKLRHGVGEKYIVLNDDQFKQGETLPKCLDMDVVKLDSCLHSVLGSLIEVTVDVQ